MKIMVSIHDAAVDAFGDLYTQRTNGEAIRGFHDGCKDNQTMLNKHPEHYTLWKLGEFNEQTGEVVHNKERLAKATDFFEGQ